MINETLAGIEKRIAALEDLPEAKKAELSALLSQLRTEVGSLARTQAPQAESIARFTALSAHEVLRGEDGNGTLRNISLQGLSASVEGFEASHPRLFETVNSICYVLSSLGL